MYWLGWDHDVALSSLNWSGVTQVDDFSLASCDPGDPRSVADGCTDPAGVDPWFNTVGDPSSFVSTVHAHGKLAIITLGGSTNPNWHVPCQPANVAAFAHNVVKYMQSSGFDGIDLDVEQDPGIGNPPFTAADLKACAQQIYSDAKAVKTAAGKVPLVTSAVDPTTDLDIGRIENPYVDLFNAMSYASSVSAQEADIANLENQTGIPASKITLARTFSTSLP